MQISSVYYHIVRNFRHLFHKNGMKNKHVIKKLQKQRLNTGYQNVFNRLIHTFLCYYNVSRNFGMSDQEKSDYNL